MRLIPTAASAVASSLTASDPGTALQKAAADVISTAMGSGLRTASVSISGKTSGDVQNFINLIKNILGYGATIVGSNIVITW